ncbi:unnamed protein product, partial [marine sediment metagenome]
YYLTDAMGILLFTILITTVILVQKGAIDGI